MQGILSTLLFLAAILNIVLGTGFLVNPENAGADFGLAVTGLHGSSTLRGDMTSFFYVSAAFMALGARRRSATLLAPALALYSVTFVGRAINLVLQGPYEGWYVTMGVEALLVGLMLAAIRSWRSAPSSI
ncbi:hypothetical protein [Erythrobacter mangrovi]|uniref:DUF4345 domain-containing protein n=1 Tax=Erythrobacter mangrovi TaxID=2739433 RepID=A0A7D3XAG8_9SPHN|nr:hypothetical protein [Erythrobacter mangrovi]QKG70580.1 hypothetical protein HQR01_03910 [Erythrobacter mangrovi]